MKKSSSNSEQSRKSPRHWLSDWGPWRRLTLYRRFQKNSRAESEYFRKRDIEENKRGRLPDSEGVQVPALWVCEIYTPSTVSGILRGIEKLGWDYRRMKNESLTKWLSDVREGRLAGWTNLGLVSPPNATHILKERTAPLPAGVKAAFPVLMSLTPSLTAFIIVFHFDNDTADSLNPLLRGEYRTTAQKNPRFNFWRLCKYILTGDSVGMWESHYPPDIQRRDATSSRLQQIESSCAEWVQKYFPGVFASLSHSRFPSAALLVTEQFRPLSTETSNIRAFDGLGLNSEYDAWESGEWPGARLVLPYGPYREGKRLTFACRRKDAFPERPYDHDPTANSTIAGKADHLIQGLLSRWALSCILGAYHEALAALRDQTAGKGKFHPIRDLKDLRSLAITLLYDIGICANEISRFSKTKVKYRHNVMEMSYVRQVQGEHPELLDELRAYQKQRGEQVAREAELLLTTLTTTNDLTRTISSIRPQRLVVLLTIVSISLAVWISLGPFSAN